MTERLSLKQLVQRLKLPFKWVKHKIRSGIPTGSYLIGIDNGSNQQWSIPVDESTLRLFRQMWDKEHEESNNKC